MPTKYVWSLNKRNITIFMRKVSFGDMKRCVMSHVCFILMKELGVQESKREVTKVVSLGIKMAEKLLSVSPSPKISDAV